jgi:hypothetical protein
MKLAGRGLADVDEAMREGNRIVEACWPDIEKLATYLQKRGRANFSQISQLLDLPNGRCVYNERTRPSMDYYRRRAATVAI